MFVCFFRILVLEEDFILLQKAIWFISCCYPSISLTLMAFMLDVLLMMMMMMMMCC
jgi:hypothetical protein